MIRRVWVPVVTNSKLHYQRFFVVFWLALVFLCLNVAAQAGPVSDLPGWPQVTGRYVYSSPMLGDLDGDGRLEVVVGSIDQHIYVWDSKGTPLPGWPKKSYYTSSSPALYDLDGDGDLDIIVGTRQDQVHAWDMKGNPLPGWPKEAGSWVDSSPALGDLDEDGYLDVVVGTDNQNVYAWDRKGNLLPGWPKATGMFIYSSPALGDLDGDGHLDVVIGSRDYKVYAWDRKGNSLPGWPKETGDEVLSSPALGDLDGDGYLDVVVGSLDNKVYAWDRKGNLLPGWPREVGNEVFSSPSLGDLDGDGYLDVVVGSEDGKVYAWDRRGNLLSGWPAVTGHAVSSSPAIGDLDNDGYPDVVVGSGDNKVYAWNRKGKLIPGWPKVTDGFVRSSPSLGDLNGDGRLDVVVGSMDGKVYAWSTGADYVPGNIQWGMFRHDLIHNAVQSDDDLFGPIAGDFSPTVIGPGEPFHISCQITDRSGVYDDTTGPEGQGVYLVWDDDGDIAGGEVAKLSRVSGDFFQTDAKIPEQFREANFVYQITAYDNDFDGNDPNDRVMCRSETQHITITYIPFVSSPTHPDPGYWYNLNDIQFTWTIYYNAPGFYIILDQSSNTIPTAKTGEHTPDKSVTYQNVADGTWYFHIVSEYKTGLADTEAVHYQVNIDTEPPSVSSKTHPAQEKWYQARRPELSWDTLHPSSVKGFYYVVDQNSDILPVSGSALRTTSKNITLNELLDGVWYFHIAWEDLAGNAGKKAAHFTLNIDDTDPPPVAQLEASVQPDKNIVLKWSDPGDDASGVDYYHVFRSEQKGSAGKKVSDDVTGTTYTDVGAGLTGKTLYYTVFPTDKAGNKQTQGNVQVQAIYPDLTPPRITSFSPTDLSIKRFIFPDNRQLSVIVLEEKGIAQNALTLHVQFIGKVVSTEKSIPMGRAGSGPSYTFTAEIPFSEASDGQEVKFWVAGTDLAGNRIASNTKPSLLAGGEAIVTIDSSPPNVTDTYPPDGAIFKQGDMSPSNVDLTTDESVSGVDSSKSIFTITRSDAEVKAQNIYGTLSISSPGHLTFTPAGRFQEGIYEASFQLMDNMGNTGKPGNLSFTIDQTAPIILGLDISSPKPDDTILAENRDVKISVMDRVKIESNDLNLNYEVYTDIPTSTPTGVSGMSKSGDKSPYTFSAILPLADVQEGKRVDYWITGSDSAGNPVTSNLKPSLLVDGKINLTIKITTEPEITINIGDVNGDGRVRSNDAILVLRISVGLIEPTEYQKLAADMNGDGMIRANDAILILRKSAGLAAPGLGASGIAVGNQRQITILLPEIQGEKSINMPLKVDNINGLAGGDICIAYKPSVLCAVDVLPNPEIAMVSNISEPGLVRIAFAGADLLKTNTLAEVRFDVLADNISPLKFQLVELYRPDAKPIDSKAIDGRFISRVMRPGYSALLQNFPNPFNPETWIPYQLSESGHVVIRIYNAAGQLIRSLDLGFKHAGYYNEKELSAYWDGRNEDGEQVSGGVYFYQINAGSFCAMRKMAIVR